MNTVRFLRTVGWVEGASYLILLFIAMPLKYLLGLPLAVRVVGMAHGLLFILLIYTLLRVAQSRRWPIKRALIVFGAALIPFGPLLIEKTLVEEMRRAEA